MKNWSETTFDDVLPGNVISFTPPKASNPFTGQVRGCRRNDAGNIVLEFPGAKPIEGRPGDTIEVYR